MNQSIESILKLRPYTKVPQDKKKQLVELVFYKNWKIKQASSHLGLNYATAKNIILKYRRTVIQKKISKLPESKRCHYKLIGLSQSRIKVISSKGGIKQEGNP